MSAVVAASPQPTLKALLGAPSRPHYRRSTTTRAPRKRTFVNLIMEKHNPGVRSAGSGSLLCKATASSASELLASACCGGNDNNVRGGNGGSNRPPRSPGGGSGSGDSGAAGQPLPRALVVGAAALMAGLVLLPSQQAAASGPGLPRTLRVAGAATHPGTSSAPRNMCLNNNDNSAHAARGAPVADGAILYGSVVLSDAERRLMARSSRQLFFSEYVRVGAGGSSAVAARV